MKERCLSVLFLNTPTNYMSLHSPAVNSYNVCINKIQQDATV